MLKKKNLKNKKMDLLNDDNSLNDINTKYFHQ